MTRFFEKLPQVLSEDPAFAIRQIIGLLTFPILLGALVAMLFGCHRFSKGLSAAGFLAAVFFGLPLLVEGYSLPVYGAGLLSIVSALWVAQDSKKRTKASQPWLKALATVFFVPALLLTLLLSQCSIDNVACYQCGM